MTFRAWMKMDPEFVKVDTIIQSKKTSIQEVEAGEKRQLPATAAAKYDKKDKTSPLSTLQVLNEMERCIGGKTAYYYKFNCHHEIKLIKQTLEDNGFRPFAGTLVPQLQTYNLQSDWLLLWSTKVLKSGFFNRLGKY